MSERGSVSECLHSLDEAEESGEEGLWGWEEDGRTAAETVAGGHCRGVDRVRGVGRKWCVVGSQWRRCKVVVLRASMRTGHVRSAVAGSG